MPNVAISGEAIPLLCALTDVLVKVIEGWIVGWLRTVQVVRIESFNCIIID